jgi:hypothetical protein
MARVRFHSLENQFRSNPKLKEDYTEFLTKMMRNNHLKRLQCPLQHWMNRPANFFLHHHVYKKTDVNKEKIRIVFDASAKTSNEQ